MDGQVFYIYKITNKINNKIYIGQTINPAERWRKHKRFAKSTRTNRPLYNAMRLYGCDNFTFEIIENQTTAELADESEKKYIAKYNSMNRDLGYNLTSGGETRKSISEETRKKMSDRAKNRSPETNKKISEALKGRISWNKGGSHPSKGTIRMPKEQQEKICQLYPTVSTQEIAIQFGYSPTTVVKVLRYNGIKVQSSKILNEGQVLEILQLIKDDISYKEIAKKYDVGESTISEINTGKRWRHVNR